MSNDDHKAPQSPEEMLEMIGKVRDPWGREDSPPIKETTEEEREELARRKWSSGQTQAEENEKAQDTTGSEEDQDRCKGIPIEHVELSIGGQKIENSPRADLEARCGKLRDGSIPIVPMDMFDLRPDPDVMGYLHSRYGVAPVMRKLCEVYDVRLGAVRLAFSPQEGEDEWYFEAEAIGSFDCGFVDGKLSDACEYADEIAREILEDALTRLA